MVRFAKIFRGACSLTLPRTEVGNLLSAACRFFDRVKIETSPRAKRLLYFPLKISVQTKQKVFTLVDILSIKKYFNNKGGGERELKIFGYRL